MKKKSKGYALLLVLVVMLSMSILGATILDISLSETKLVAYQQNHRQAYYMARSGADAMASYIINNSGQIQNLINNTSSNPATGIIGNNSFQVKVISGATVGSVMIKSQGIVNGTSPVNVNLTLLKTPNIALNSAIFSDNAPDIGNNTTVIGDMQTNGPNITFGSNKVIGNITLGPDASQADIQNAIAKSSGGTVQKLSSRVVFPPITDMSQFPIQYNSSTDKLTDGVKLYRYTTDSSLSSINIQWASSHVSGNTSELHLFVNNSNLSIPSSVNPPSGVTLYLYYNGTDTMTGNGIFGMSHLFIYAPQATFNINGGGNGTFIGKMIVKNASFPNSNSTIKNDPSININDVVVGQTYQRSTWSN